MNSFYLNDLGVICALGNNRRTVVETLLAGSRAGLILSADYSPDRETRVGAVREQLPALPSALAALNCRNNQLALAALQQIDGTIAAMKKRWGRDRIGVVMGTSTSGIGASEIALAQWQNDHTLPPTYNYRQQQLGSLAECVAALIDCSGPAYTISTACSSSANALGSARRLIAQDICDVVVVGGVDTLCQLTVQGFASLESLSAGYCNPFSRNRDGINIGEAAAIFVMSREPGPVALMGVGASSDAHHISAPEPSGRGAIAAMQAALQHAGITASDVDYLNLHGTGTRQNDAMESIAVHTLFGERLPCSSTKALTGHTLGAAGALEAGLCWLLLTQNPETQLAPHIWDGERDDSLPALQLTTVKQSATPLNICMSNSFAFGGNNTSVVLGRSPS